MAGGPVDRSWADFANCTSCDVEELFSTSTAQRELRDLCQDCRVRLECLADALQSNMKYGLWGGLTERERRQLLRMVPIPNDWYHALKSSPDPVFVALREGKSLQSVRRTKATRR